MINEVKLEVGGVGPRHLGQPRDGLSGQLYDRQVKRIGLGQTVVSQIITKPNQLYFNILFTIFKGIN